MFSDALQKTGSIFSIMQCNETWRIIQPRYSYITIKAKCFVNFIIIPFLRDGQVENMITRRGWCWKRFRMLLLDYYYGMFRNSSRSRHSFFVQVYEGMSREKTHLFIVAFL